MIMHMNISFAIPTVLFFIQFILFVSIMYIKLYLYIKIVLFYNINVY